MSRFNPDPIPADFTEVAPSSYVAELMTRYGVVRDTILRWCKEAGITVPKHKREPEPAPADLAECAKKFHFKGLVRHYGRTDKVVRRWLLETEIKPRSFNFVDASKKQWQENPIRPRVEPKLPKPLKGRLILPGGPRQAPRDTSREGDAADYLKRWFVPVYRCTAEGVLHSRPHPTHYRLGNMIVTTEDMLATAKRKGWNPLAWTEVAA